jgi:hypothetical protein
MQDSKARQGRLRGKVVWGVVIIFPWKEQQLTDQQCWDVDVYVPHLFPLTHRKRNADAGKGPRGCQSAYVDTGRAHAGSKFMALLEH